jgi:hypothetical protein
MMAVQVFEERGGKLGVLTDCQDEAEFVTEFSRCASEAILKAGDVGNPSGGPRSWDEQLSKMVDGSAPVAAELLRRAVEIVLKYRGYKSEAKERRELFAGDAFPTLGDDGAAFSSGTQARA